MATQFDLFPDGLPEGRETSHYSRCAAGRGDRASGRGPANGAAQAQSLGGPRYRPEAAIPGLSLWPGVVDEEQAGDFAALIDAAPLAPFRFGRWEGKRLTASYGSGYDYQRGALTQAPPLPPWLRTIADRLAALAGLDPAHIAQALLIRYDAGAGIGWHRDRPQYADILGLSLDTPCTLRLRRRLPDQSFERGAIPLPPRSLYRLSGAVRWHWHHSIAPLPHTRRSITLRTLR